MEMRCQMVANAKARAIADTKLSTYQVKVVTEITMWKMDLRATQRTLSLPKINDEGASINFLIWFFIIINFSQTIIVVKFVPFFCNCELNLANTLGDFRWRSHNFCNFEQKVFHNLPNTFKSNYLNEYFIIYWHVC